MSPLLLDLFYSATLKDLQEVLLIYLMSILILVSKLVRIMWLLVSLHTLKFLNFIYEMRFKICLHTRKKCMNLIVCMLFIYCILHSIYIIFLIINSDRCVTLTLFSRSTVVV